jgi:nitroreductase
MQALEALRTRRSIRSYKTSPVSDAVKNILLECAMSAPSANNLRPWYFILLNDKKIRYSIAKFHPFAKMLRKAPGAIAVCGNLDIENEKNYLALDCAAATENILLAAHALGLGAVWIGIYPREERITALSQILQLPAHILPISVVAYGYPSEKKGPLKRFDEKRIYFDRWGSV